MGKKGIESLVGLFVLMGLLGLVFLALKAANLGSMGGGDTYEIRARCWKNCRAWANTVCSFCRITQRRVRPKNTATGWFRSQSAAAESHLQGLVTTKSRRLQLRLRFPTDGK